jgi:hypothetical protein
MSERKIANTVEGRDHCVILGSVKVIFLRD